MQGKRHLRFTIYDLRFTICEVRARCAGCGAVAADAAYVRFTIYDVRFEL